MRPLHLAIAFLLYIGALGAHPVAYPTPLTGNDLEVSFVAQDTDSDDDVVSSPCLCHSSFDDGLQNFDRAPLLKLAFRPESRRFFFYSTPTLDVLDDDGLFRPPRANLL